MTIDPVDSNRPSETAGLTTIDDFWRSLWQRGPVTICVAGLIVMLFMSIEWSVKGLGDGSERLEIVRNFGIAEDLIRKDLPKLRGPLDVWRGEVWRIPITAFHFGGRQNPERFFVMLFTVIAILWFGLRVEPRMGTAQMIALVCSSMWIGILMEFATAFVCRGAGGLATSLFGCSVMLDRSERTEQRHLAPILEWSGFALVSAAVITRFTTDIRIPAIMYVSGLVVGLITGWLVSWSHRRQTIAAEQSSPLMADAPADRYRRFAVPAWLFAACPALVVVLLSMAAKPTYLAMYHWFMAESSYNLHERENLLKSALEIDPELIEARLRLVDIVQRTRGNLPAWSVAVEALDRHRSTAEVTERVQSLWDSLTGRGEQLAAIETLMRHFKPDGALWVERLRLTPDLVATRTKEPAGTASRIGALQRDHQEWSLIELPNRFSNSLPEEFPGEPWSAALGIAL